MSNAAKKLPEPTAEKTIPITNIQKIGVLRLHGDGGKVPLGKYIDIEPGKTEDVPLEIWDRYKDRPDVVDMDRIKMVAGGLKPGEIMKTPSAQDIALSVRERELDIRTKELEEKISAAEKYRAELEVAKEKLSGR